MIATLPFVALCSLGDVDGDRVSDLAILCSDRLFLVSMAEHRTLLAIGSPKVPTGDSGSFIGTAVSAVGDLDADGKNDFAVAWSVQEGRGSTRIQVHSSRDARILWTVDDHESHSCALANPGDLDGDGIPDLLVGTPGCSFATGAVGALSGKDGSRIYRIAGEFRSSSFGCSIATLGDLDGDRRLDYAVGAPGPGNCGPKQEGPQPFDAEHRFGAIHVLSGSTGKRIRIVYGAQVVAEDGQGFGSVLASGEDFDHDGVQDLVVGQGEGFSTGARRQRVFVLSGKSADPMLEVTRDGSASDLYGRSLAVLPDRSGDGIPEILVGAPEWNLGDRPGEQKFVQDVGAAEIVNGADGRSIRIWTGENAFEGMGQQLLRFGELACIATLDRIVLVSWKTGSVEGSIHLDALASSLGK